MTQFPVIVGQDGDSHMTGSPDLMGATVNPPKGTPGYTGVGPVSLANAATFDKALGVGPVAMACQKVYTAMTMGAGWAAYAQGGGRLIVCCEPPATMTAADLASFSAFVKTLVATLPAGSFELVLWQEPQTRKHFGGNPTLYHEVVAFYAPTVRSLAPGVKIVYDPALAGDKDLASPQSCIDFFPGAAYTDAAVLDWYLTSELQEGDAYGALQAIGALLDPLKIPLGIGEFNVSASTMPTTRDQWETFADVIVSYWYGRLEAGLDNAEICFWMGEQSGLPDLLGEQIVALRRIHYWLAP